MSKGDELAGGRKSAQFQVAGGDEFVHDLKTMTVENFIERYDVDEDGYRELLARLDSGEPIPPVQRRQKNEPIPMHHPAVTTPPVKVHIPEKPQYRAECRGDNVLVIRVEREHSSMLIIPESARAKSDVGRVAAVGKDVTRASKGELVLFDRFAAHGKEIELLDDQGIPRQHLLLNDVDILLGLERVAKETIQ